MSQQLSLCCSAIASRLSATQTHFEECLASTSERQFNAVLEKFSFVSTFEKQFDSTVEWISMGEIDTDFALKCRQSFDLTVERLASTSDVHFESMVASICFVLTDKEQYDHLPQWRKILTQRSNSLPQRAKDTVLK